MPRMLSSALCLALLSAWMALPTSAAQLNVSHKKISNDQHQMVYCDPAGSGDVDTGETCATGDHSLPVKAGGASQLTLLVKTTAGTALYTLWDCRYDGIDDAYDSTSAPTATQTEAINNDDQHCTELSVGKTDLGDDLRDHLNGGATANDIQRLTVVGGEDSFHNIVLEITTCTACVSRAMLYLED